MRLKEGQKAVDFEVKDILGNEISLSDYKGKKLLLSFYRYASCPLCNLRVNELIQYEPIFREKGMEMLAVFESPKESINEYVGKQNAPFPIIADPKRKLYKLYGVETSVLGTLRAFLKPSRFKEAMNKGFKAGKSEGAKTLIPADFIIDANLNISKSYYGKDIGDHMPIEMIMKEVLKK
jgi:peroxiredoxin